ncbi:short-chain collagen C4-like [Watersipora subatra]|uniref:short-chain collagen C4-like n=1 Tax=Watersipora subatra TaxID=2589382 RepID=UPI00355BDB31
MRCLCDQNKSLSTENSKKMNSQENMSNFSILAILCFLCCSGFIFGCYTIYNLHSTSEEVSSLKTLVNNFKEELENLKNEKIRNHILKRSARFRSYQNRTRPSSLQWETYWNQTTRPSSDRGPSRRQTTIDVTTVRPTQPTRTTLSSRPALTIGSTLPASSQREDIQNTAYKSSNLVWTPDPENDSDIYGSPGGGGLSTTGPGYSRHQGQAQGNRQPGQPGRDRPPGQPGSDGQPGQAGNNSQLGDTGTSGREGPEGLLPSGKRESTASSRGRPGSSNGSGGIGSTFVRWGKVTCPQVSTLLYSGYAAAANPWYGMGGSTELECLSTTPSWHGNATTTVQTSTKLFAAKFSLGSFHGIFDTAADNSVITCAVCLTTKAPVITLPGRVECLNGWHKEYNGYLMATSAVRYEIFFSSRNYCIDRNPDYYTGHNDTMGMKLTFLQAGGCYGGLYPCHSYTENNILACTVCSQHPD